MLSEHEGRFVKRQRTLEQALSKKRQRPMSIDKHLNHPDGRTDGPHCKFILEHHHINKPRRPPAQYQERFPQKTWRAQNIMVSHTIKQLILLFTVVSIAGIMAVLYTTDAWMRCFFGRRTRDLQGDEEQARPAGPGLSRSEGWRESRVSLDELSHYSRSSSTAPILPSAVPPAYISRTWREGGTLTDRTPRPVPSLPPLYYGSLLVASPQQQSPQVSPILIVANDSRESIGTEAPPLHNAPAPPVSPLRQSSPQIRNPFANCSTESLETEVADLSNLTPEPPNTPVLSAFPLPLSLQAHIQTGTVDAHRPAVTSPVRHGSDDARGRVVSNMVNAIERGRSSNFSSKAEPSDPGELPPSPLLRSVLNRISNVRERWTHIDM
jgi:hypothetical protein